MGRKKKYFTEEERITAKRERQKLYHEKHKNEEKFKASQKAKNKRWRDKHKYEEEFKALQKTRNAEYKSTQIGRAKYLLMNYRRADIEHNRGECTLTEDWIISNIFTQPCAHCGESDWKKLGCNRLDNNLPHTPDNVEPCCWECNIRLGKEWTKECLSKPVYQYTLDGELVKIWSSTIECGRNGYQQANVSACCLGKRKSHKGHRWSFEPL